MNLKNLATKVPATVFSMVEAVIAKYEITHPLRLCHFMSQIAHESGNFTQVVENMNYSVDGLLKTFPRYFPTRQFAIQYARQPEKIGNRVYANRMGNGDEASGEGFKYRGRGYLQLTGKFNYSDFSKFIGEDCVADPELVAAKYPMDSAVWFFNKNNIWEICDRGSSEAVIQAVTRRVNGGLNGILDRTKKFKAFYEIIG
jgi:putative chitinase